MALKFPANTSRVGTIKDSIYGIKNTIDYLEQEGKIEYKSLGASADGKVNNEYRIFPTDGTPPFTIYDYRFGFDPSDEDHYEEEYNFSIGGIGQESEESAKQLGFEVISDLDEEFVRQMKYKAGIIK
jgi:hypothetical protein